jgi:hypothetical protein
VRSRGEKGEEAWLGAGGRAFFNERIELRAATGTIAGVDLHAWRSVPRGQPVCPQRRYCTSNPFSESAVSSVPLCSGDCDEDPWCRRPQKRPGWAMISTVWPVGALGVASGTTSATRARAVTFRLSLMLTELHPTKELEYYSPFSCRRCHKPCNSRSPLVSETVFFVQSCAFRRVPSLGRSSTRTSSSYLIITGFCQQVK